MTALDDIRRACDRLGRLPESRWSQPPRLPLGSRAPLEPAPAAGPSLAVLVRGVCAQLMAADARVRGVQQFVPQVSVFALADVLEALARSVAANADPSTPHLLEQVAAETRGW